LKVPCGDTLEHSRVELKGFNRFYAHKFGLKVFGSGIKHGIALGYNHRRYYECDGIIRALV
jgi:hypothetical protein